MTFADNVLAAPTELYAAALPRMWLLLPLLLLLRVLLQELLQ